MKIAPPESARAMTKKATAGLTGIDSTLPSLFFSLRQRRGISLAVLGRRTQISRTTLYRWEAGRTTPRVQELLAVLDALNVSPTERQQCLGAIDAPRGIRHLKTENEAAQLPVGTGEMLRALRLRAGRSQADAAAATGVSQGMISQWERDVSLPDEHSLHLLCQTFQATSQETALLVARAGDLVPPLPQDYDALNRTVQNLISFEPTPHLDLPFLSLASRYHSLWKQSKIEYEDAAGAWGYYADFLAWRHGRYEDAIYLANVALKSLEIRQKRFLTDGHYFAFMALIAAYNLSDQAHRVVDLLERFEDRLTPNHALSFQFFRGEAFYRAGNHEQGLHLIKDAIQRTAKERQFVVWSQICAEFLCQKERYGEALDIIVPSAKDETRPSVLHGHTMTLAWALAGTGEIDEANRLYRETRPQIGSDLSPLMRAIVGPVEALLSPSP